MGLTYLIKVAKCFIVFNPKNNRWELRGRLREDECDFLFVGRTDFILASDYYRHRVFQTPS